MRLKNKAERPVFRVILPFLFGRFCVVSDNDESCVRQQTQFCPVICITFCQQLRESPSAGNTGINLYESHYLAVLELPLRSVSVFCRHDTRFFLEYLREILRVCETYCEGDAAQCIVCLAQHLACLLDTYMANEVYRCHSGRCFHLII